MKLQRITSQGRWIPEIDGLRFLAIFAVLISHICGEALYGTQGVRAQGGVIQGASLLTHLDWGVPLFFIISGMILSGPFIRAWRRGGAEPNLRAFYLRRVTRLEPPYILSLLLYAACWYVFRHQPSITLGRSLLSSLLYVHNFYRRYPAVNFVTWSLEVEVQFYLLAPFMAQIFKLHSAVLRRLILVIGIAASACFPSAKLDHLGFLLPGQLAFFWAGYLLADLDVVSWATRFWLWDIVGGALWVAALVISDSRGKLTEVCLLTAAIMVSMQAPVVRRMLGVRWVALLGGMCYSLYLTHMLVLGFTSRMFRGLINPHQMWGSCLIALCVELPIVIGCGTLYFILIERPCMNPRWPQDLAAAVRRSLSSTYPAEVNETSSSSR